MKHIILALACCLVATCATTNVTPEQAQAWANVGHTVVHNGLIDAKDVMTQVGQ